MTDTTDAPFVVVTGTCDTKSDELVYLRDLVRAAGVAVKLVDVAPRGSSGAADVATRDVLAALPGAAEELAATGDRGQAVAIVARAFAAWVDAQAPRILGMIGAGGSGNTALITPGMGRLPVGTPKIMISTVASGDVAPYVGPNDIAMLYSVVDLAGLNSISRRILGNAANMMAGAVTRLLPDVAEPEKPALGLTMFGVTTPCIEQVVARLEADYECFVFHATGTGGRTMEKLADSGRLAGMIDVTTTEVAEIVMEMAREVLPVVKHTPVLAGVNGTDPFCIFDHYLDQLKALGFAGVQNFPTVGLIDGVFRQNLEETGMGYAHEVEMIRLAAAKDMLTTPYVFGEADAVAMAEAGADIIVCHLGLTTGGSIGADTAVKLEDCPAMVDRWAAAAQSVNPDVIVLVHGGPVSMPEDAGYVLKTARHCHGFYGASSMERLPTEVALTEQTRAFKSISF